MTNYIPADKLIAEIERLKNYAECSKNEWINEGYNQNAFAEDCRIDSFDKLLSFIKSLQQEQTDANKVEKALSLQIQAYLTTASDELYAPGKPLYTKEHHEGIHECMKMWQKLHQYYFSTKQEQPIQANTLTWKDINDLERIINNVHYEFRAGIGEKSFGEEVLERFREERDEQKQPEINLEKEIDSFFPESYFETAINFDDVVDMAYHFYRLGLNARKEN